MKDKYFLADLILTFLLLLSVIFLLKDAVSVYWLYLLFIASGFWLSWFSKDRRQEQFIKLFVAIGTFAALAWMSYTILNSSLLYKDVIVICIKGALFLEVVLSFNVCWAKYLAYMQALSIPLFMCLPLVTRDYNVISIIAILGYLVCWPVLLKAKFYEFFRKPINEISFKGNYATYLLAAIFIISLSISGLLFFKLPFRKVIKGGIFSQRLTTEANTDVLEKEYYELQEKLQKKITELIPDFRLTDDRYSALGWLSYLIKESSTIMEVDKALQGLVSYLKKPGLGLEGESEEVTVLLKNFVDKKAALALSRIIDAMMNALKENPFNLKVRIAIAGLTHKIQNSSSLQEALEYERQLKQVIDNSSLKPGVKKKLEELALQLIEWKAFGLKQYKAYSENKPSENKEIKEQPAEQIIPPLTKEYPQAPEKYLQEKMPSSNISIALHSLIKKTINWVLILILCIPILFLVLYFLTEKQKNKLVSLCKDPREFIINLYGNLREILIIFGSTYSGVLSPLFYAELIEHRYSIKNNSFLRLTAKFEEAKYSQHILNSKDVYPALDDYNDFLKVIFNKQNKFHLFLKYCLTLLHRKPLSIYKDSLLANST